MKKIMVALIGFVLVMSLMSCEADKAVGMSLDTLNIEGEVTSVKMNTVSGFSGKPMSADLYEMGFRYTGNQEIFFNDDGMVDYFVDYQKDGSVSKERYFFYDMNNVVSSYHETFYGFGNITGEHELIFETKDDKVIFENQTVTGRSHNLLDEDFEVLYLKYELDNDMRTVKSIFYSEGMKSQTHEEFVYNDDGFITKTTYYIDDEVSAELTFEYDSDANMVKTLIRNKDGQTLYEYDYEYDYDDNNNWTEQRIYIGADHKYTTTRTIEYK